MSKNDITGDALRSRVSSDAYRSAFDGIFKKAARPIYYWADDTWCEAEDLESMTHMSDDHTVLSVPEGAEYNEVEFLVMRENRR